MRTKECWTLLHVSVFAVLLIAVKAQSEEDCAVVINVHRNAKYSALVGATLRIFCPVTFCNNSTPTMSWVKVGETNVPVNVSPGSRFQSKWETLQRSNGVYILIIQKVERNDSGLYQCQSEHGTSFNIKVFVNDVNGTRTVTEKNDINWTTKNPEQLIHPWTYISIGAGIMGFVILVIIVSVISMRGCKGKPKKGTQQANQYIVVPIVEAPSQNATVQPSPRGSPMVPLPRRSTRRKAPPPQPNEAPSPGDECIYSRVKEDRGRPRNTAEVEAGSVVYAALNHQVPARPVARPRRQKEESSEYAAIRVKDSAPRH